MPNSGELIATIRSFFLIVPLLARLIVRRPGLIDSALLAKLIRRSGKSTIRGLNSAF